MEQITQCFSYLEDKKRDSNGRRLIYQRESSFGET